MPNRDYVARARAKKKPLGKTTVLLLVGLLLLGVAGAIWLLVQSAPKPSQPVVKQTTTPPSPKTTLPTPPEEVYSYIRDLETREVPVDKNSKLAKLTREQELQIQKRKEEEQRKLQETQTQAAAVVTPTAATEPEQHLTTEPKKADVAAEKSAEQKELEQKQAEERRKQAELRKQELAKQEALKKAEQAKKEEQAKVAASANTNKVAEQAKSAGKFGLQCGAFKNRAQAENMQARLAMAGYHARINSNAEWNRVVVGPIGDRAAASSAQSNARSVAECLIVAM